MMIFRVSEPDKVQSFRYLRTRRSGKISEATLLVYLRQTFLLGLASKPDSVVTRYIRQLQSEDTGTGKAA